MQAREVELDAPLDYAWIGSAGAMSVVVASDLAASGPSSSALLRQGVKRSKSSGSYPGGYKTLSVLNRDLRRARPEMPDPPEAQSDARRLRSDAAANRDSILAAATIAVRRDGERVPMATIAEEAGVGIGTLYRH